MKSDKALMTKNTHQLLLQYLFPSISATLFISLNYFVDSVCVGQRLGETGITALGIAQPAAGVLYGLGSLFGVGGSTLFSVFMGRGEVKAARSCYTACIATLTVLLVAIQVLGLVFLPQIVTFLGGVGEARQGVTDYLKYVFAFAPVFGLEVFLCCFMRNDRAPRRAMLSTFIGSGLNIILDVLFVLVFDFGIIGASLATSLAICVAVMFLFISTGRRSSNMRFARPDAGIRVLPRAARIGLSSLILEISPSVTLLVFNLMLLRISGETAVAVYGVIGNLSIVVGNALAGVSNAMQPIVSANVGAGRIKRARSALRYSMLYSLGIVLVFLSVGEIFPDSLIRIFVDGDADFMAMAAPALRISFLAYLPASMNILFSMYFQSSEEPAPAIFLTILRGVILPVVSVVGLGLYVGIDGIWFSSLATELIAAITVLFLYRGVRNRMQARNYAKLQYFAGKKAHETLDEILKQLGADDLTSFSDLIQYCNACDENTQSIPAYVCLEDLTVDYEGGYAPAEDDEDMGLFLAVGGIVFTDLYEQNDSYMQDKLKEADYPAAAPAMNVLAEKCFRFEYDEGSDKTTVIPYRRGIAETDALTGELLPEEDL